MIKESLTLRNWILIGCVALLFTILSVGFVNGYRYGVGDHSQVLPFVKDLVRPELYPNDLLIEQRQYFYTFLWYVVAALHNIWGIPLVYLFFGLYFVNLFLILLATYLIAYALFQRHDVACLSLFLLLFYRGYLAGQPVLENIFITRSAATATVLFMFYAFLQRRYFRAAILLGVTFDIHALTAVYASVMIGMAVIFFLPELRRATLIKGFFIFLAVASPVLVWRLLYAPESSKLIYADPQWLQVLRLRIAEHHFPFSWSPLLFVQAALRLLVFSIAWKHKPDSDQHRAIVGFTVGLLLMMLLGTIFVEWIPVSVIVQIQLFRSFALIIYFVVIYFANFFIIEMEQRSTLLQKCGVALSSLAVFLVFKPFVRTFTFLGIVLLMFLYVFLQKRQQGPRQSIAIAATLMLVCILSYPASKGLDSDFSIKAAKSPMIKLARWMKQETGIDDLVITSPNLHGFRIESERTVYVDWKDGCLAQMNPDFGNEWLRRMKILGFNENNENEKGYEKLKEEIFRKLARQMHAANTYVVTEKGDLNFPLIHKEGNFQVYKIPAGQISDKW